MRRGVSPSSSVKLIEQRNSEHDDDPYTYNKNSRVTCVSEDASSRRKRAKCKCSRRGVSAVPEHLAVPVHRDNLN